MGNWISKLFQPRRHRTQRSRNSIDIEHERSSETWSHIEMPISESATSPGSGEGAGDIQGTARDDEAVGDVNTAATAPPGSLATTLSRTTPGLDLIRDLTPEERRELGRIIATALQCHYVQLINSIDVQVAAHHFFGAQIITDNERDMAVTTGLKSPQTRAGELIAILIKRVEASPHKFKAVCTAFEQAGAESIIDEIKAEVQQKFEEKISESSSKAQISLKPSKEAFTQTYFNSEDNCEQFELTGCVVGSGHSSSQCLELSECFTETNPSITPSPLHIICGSIPQDEDEGTEKKRKDSLVELQRLLREGANCTWKDEDGNTPLHIAAGKGDAEVVNILLHHVRANGPADVINTQNNKLHTVLHISTMKNFPVVTALVCEQVCCTPNIPDKAQRNALHYACASGIIDAVKPLLMCCSHEGFVNAADENGDTPLHIATRNGFIEIMKLLRKNKADPKGINLDKQSPIDIARNCPHPKAIQVLTKSRYGCISLSWYKRSTRMRNSSSSSAISSHRSMSITSVNSSACSEISRYSHRSKK